MPIYEYACTNCGYSEDRYYQMGLQKSSTSCDCGSDLTRQYTPPALPKSFQPHYNHSVGQFVRNEREFADALARGSDEQSERTGVEHRYVKLEGDEAKRGVTEDGMEATREAWNL